MGGHLFTCPFFWSYYIGGGSDELGEASSFKNGEIWDNVPNRLDPAPLSDILDFFEFQTYLKNADPPLSDQFETIFRIETFIVITNCVES